MECSVRFLPSGLVAQVPAGTSLLEAARGAGLAVASACGADGVCGRCGLRILRASPPPQPESEREAGIKAANRVDPELRLACRVEVAGDLVVTATYW